MGGISINKTKLSQFTNDLGGTGNPNDGSVSYLKLTSFIKNLCNAWGFIYSDSDLLIPNQLLPNNFLIIDKYGVPHWMVEIPRKNWDPTNTFASTIIHPAYIVNGTQKRIFIGKYQLSQISVQGSSRYVTWANQAIKTSLTFDQFDTAINALNDNSNVNGFHMITNAEWALVALLCKARGLMPYGNNAYGRDIDDKSITGELEAALKGNFAGSSGDARWLSGSGGPLTAHDRMATGIYDLNGNVYEWVRGFRSVDGEIQILANNNAADYNKSVAGSSTEWKAILQDESLVVPSTALTLKMDSTGTGASGDVGDIKVNTTVTNNTGDTAYAGNTFESTSAQSGITVPDLLKSLCIYPYTTGLGSDYMQIRNNGERLPLRGGYWANGAYAGGFYLSLYSLRSNAGTSIGSRAAFYL